MNWKIGQKLVCIQDDWDPWFTGKVRKGDIVTYDGPGVFGHFKIREEFDTFYHSDRFRPMLGDSAKQELISSFTEVTETSDLPIRSPQPVPSSCGS